MKLTDKLSIRLPFPGFYESIYSSELNHEAEQWAASEANYRQAEEGVAKELRLDADEYAGIVSDVQDYRVAEIEIARAHVEAVDYVVKRTLGFALDLEFEEMTSPHEYNFETDRVFAMTTYGRMLRLAALSRKDGHVRLKAEIKRRFTSRDGFCPYYSNSLDTWLAKPLILWDYNELETLLLTVSEYDFTDDKDLAVYYRIDDYFYEAWSRSVNWAELRIKVAEARADKLAKLQAEDPSYVPPVPRDRDTPDLFS